MNLTRREWGKLALATATTGTLVAARPDSRFAGVQIGVITYSYRDHPELANNAEALLKLLVASNVSAIELMPPVAEAFAGAPPKAAPADLKKWRLSASLEPFKALRKLYNDAGVSIYCHKLTPNASMSDEEYEYMFAVAAALGARQVSLELSNDAAFTQRLGDFALRHNMVAAYHYHTKATLTAWDAVLAQSKGNAVNLDCGHYVAGTGLSPIPALEKYGAQGRIASIHLKDRTTPAHGALNLPWGKGDTPIAEILRTIQKNKWTFPATIELEYDIPEGSTAVAEVNKCVEFCRQALT